MIASQPAATATSRTRSSDGSGKKGRQRKKMSWGLPTWQIKSIKSPISFSEIEGGKFPRFNTSSYSMISGTEIETKNLPLGRRETKLYDAPHRDLKAENITFVSTTIFRWYYISYHYMIIKFNLFYILVMVVLGDGGRVTLSTWYFSYPFKISFELTGINRCLKIRFDSSTYRSWFIHASPPFMQSRNIVAQMGHRCNFFSIVWVNEGRTQCR